MNQNIAHRGFSGIYPENTMLAFRKAVSAGCDGIELDVHLTRDGALAILHDEHIGRTTDGKGLVKDMTIQELQRFNAAAIWNGAHPAQHIPTLEEYFDFAKGAGILTNIELKNDSIWYDGMEEKVLDVIRRYGLEERVILSSFNHYSILKCKRLAPHIPCGFLCSCWIVDIGAYARRHGVEYVHPYGYCLNEVSMTEIRKNGIGINTWTIDEEVDIRFCVGKVDGIISNYPDRVAAVLKESNFPN